MKLTIRRIWALEEPPSLPVIEWDLDGSREGGREGGRG